jgi:hypothetical protein
MVIRLRKGNRMATVSMHPGTGPGAMRVVVQGDPLIGAQASRIAKRAAESIGAEVNVTHIRPKEKQPVARGRSSVSFSGTMTQEQWDKIFRKKGKGPAKGRKN